MEGSTPTKRSLLLPLCLVLGIFGLLCILNKDRHSETVSLRQNVRLSNFLQENTNNPLSVKISNEYIERDGEPTWKYPWLISSEEGGQVLLAEPYRASKIYLENAVENISELKWILTTPDGTVLKEHSGVDSATFFFENLGVYTLTIRQYTEDGQQLSSTKVKVVVKYVRREIRSLTDDDLEGTLDTMETLWRVPNSVGKKLYGEQYLSADELLKVHLILAGAVECDHMHDGMGFIPHHSALTYLFEKSMQAVNPKYSLPYWDYAMDFEEIKNLKGSFEDFVNSAIFNEKYFGGTDPETHYISNGRWKNLQVPTNDYLSEHEMETMPFNSFGHMRSPWSSNSDPHLIRTATMCGVDPTSFYPTSDCSTFYDLLHTDTLEKYGQAVSYDPHGPVHILLGGTLHCTEGYDALEEYFTKEEVYDFKSFSFAFHKNLFRAGILFCEKGKEYCECPDLEYYMSSEVLRKSFLLNAKLLGDYTEDQIRALAEALCNSGLVDGDQLQASSSFAPEFWPIHPTLERAYQWKQISYPFSDTTWMSGSGTWISYDLVDFCYGHRAEDIVLNDYFQVKVDHVEGPITNAQWMELLSPELDVLPFVYDNFDWHYCESAGYSML